MIVKKPDGWHVYSESKRNGKRRHLGGPYKTKSEAVNRIRQVEGHKQHP